jgi:NADPH:quinone reductase-like Zn-dependent oxidoreductase
VFGVVTKPHLGAGSMAQYVTVPAAIGVAHPDGISERDAGALGVAGSAAFELAALSPIAGGTELISGATGGVGALAVQFAVARGSRVIATAKPGTETEFVSALTDADVLFVDYTQDVTAQVRAIAPGGVDAVLHLAGDLTELTALARDGGAVVSALATPEASEDRRLQTTVIWANPNAVTLSILAEQVVAGTLSVPVTSAYDLEQAAEAFAAFGAGTLGKIALTIG